MQSNSVFPFHSFLSPMLCQWKAHKILFAHWMGPKNWLTTQTPWLHGKTDWERMNKRRKANRKWSILFINHIVQIDAVFDCSCYCRGLCSQTNKQMEIYVWHNVIANTNQPDTLSILTCAIRTCWSAAQCTPNTQPPSTKHQHPTHSKWWRIATV